MLNEARDRILQALAAGHVGVLGLRGCMLPVRYCARERVVECLVPRWSAVEDLLAEDPSVGLTLLVATDPDLAWVSCQGLGRVIAAPHWERLLPNRPQRVKPADLYCVIAIEPDRIELIDQRQGWGARETLDF